MPSELDDARALPWQPVVASSLRTRNGLQMSKSTAVTNCLEDRRLEDRHTKAQPISTDYISDYICTRAQQLACEEGGYAAL